MDLVLCCGFQRTRSEARRLLAERGVRLNHSVIEDVTQPIAVRTGDIVQRGKRRFVRLILP